MSCYDSPTRCTSGPAPGALGLMDAILLVFTHLRSWGIYNCRPVNHPGGGGLSVHGEGRALDIAGPFAAMQALVDVLLSWVTINGKRDTIAGHLGLQFLIFNRKKYGCEWGWTARAYGGYAHTDHVHAEERRAVAAIPRDVMKARAVKLFKGEEEDDMAQVDQQEWEQVKKDVADVKSVVTAIGGVTGLKTYVNGETLIKLLTKDSTPNESGGYVAAVDFFADAVLARVSDVQKAITDQVLARLDSIDARLATIEGDGT